MRRIAEMSYEELIEERKELEKFIIKLIVRNQKENIKLYKILRGENKRMLVFSPFSINKFSSLFISDILRWRYHQLSEEIHKYYDDRFKIKYKIEKICGYEIKEQYIHLFYEKVFKDYNTYKKYCNQNNKQIIKLQKFNQVCNLIKKWRRISVDMHYKMTPDEKRKLKKILKESNKSNKRP
jgi:hypothetical protein